MATISVLLWASFTKKNAPIVQLLSIVGLAVGIVFPVAIAGSLLSEVHEVQVIYCPPRACDEAEFARSLREAGDLEAAEQAARVCLDMEPASSSEEACLESCARELVLVLYEKAAPDALPSWGSEDWRACCGEAQEQLEEAYAVAQEYNLEVLAMSIEERQCRIGEACAPPTVRPTPTPALEIEVLCAQREERGARVDVRVLQAGQPLHELQAGDFSLSVGGQPVPFTLETRSADDPVCLIAVVDNSGSIAPGLSQIREALEKLNDVRKPGDELGLVVFGAHHEVSIWQPPSGEQLRTGGVDASGRYTALWDGVLTGLEAARSCSIENRYLVVLTDGHDNDSQRLGGDSMAQAREVARRAAEQGVNICTVGVRSDDLEPEPLALVAYGCADYYAEDFDAVASSFVEIFGYVRDFYRLRVEPEYVPSGAEVVLQVLDAAEETIEFTNQNP